MATFCYLERLFERVIIKIVYFTCFWIFLSLFNWNFINFHFDLLISSAQY
jgi:hypothetical protein